MLKILSFTLSAVLLLSSVDDAAQRTVGPLAQLTGHTGWIQLVDIRADNQFATAKSFEWIGDKQPQKFLPEKGDVIKLLAPRELVILHYWPQKDERRAIESPAKYLETSGVVLNHKDYTGLICPEGAKLRVADVQNGPIIHGVKSVWVRVEASGQ